MARDGFIYGRHPVAELLRRSPQEVHRVYLAVSAQTGRLKDLVREAGRHGIQVVEVSRRSLGDMVGDVAHQGVVAMVARFRYREVEDILGVAQQRDEAPLVVILDQVQDPHNLGSLIRSSFALGAHGVIIPKDRACEVTPTVVKTSAGATAHLAVARVTNLRRTIEDLKQAGLWVFGMAADGDRAAEDSDLAQPLALVIGSEGKGLRRLVAQACDVLIKIPMAGDLGSLNASVAGGICLYEAARQRRLAG